MSTLPPWMRLSPDPAGDVFSSVFELTYMTYYGQIGLEIQGGNVI